MEKKVPSGMYRAVGTMNNLKPWPAPYDDMAEKNRAQGKSKKALTKKAKAKKKKDVKL